MEVEWDGHCFGCGPLNTDGLRLMFEPGPERETLGEELLAIARAAHGRRR